ncbi:MAG TPA: hypothetical protein PLK30_21900 [Blastocatellia bacterium]|nr:hypothetical protein [Blastocatellia bacterium]
MKISLSINGAKYEADVELRLPLDHTIRDVIGLTGTLVGFETSTPATL